MKMTRHTLALFLSTLFIFSSCAVFHNSDSFAVRKRENYAKWIINNKTTFDQQYLNHWNESAEGGESKAYFHNRELVLIESFFWGETGKSITRYFVKENKLVYIEEENRIYNRPVFYDKELAKEFDDEEYFMPEKTIVKTNRYYFQHEELVRWINNKNKKEKQSEEKYAAIEKKWLNHFEKIRHRFQ